MDPSTPSVRSMQAYLLAGIFLLVGTLLFVSVVKALFTESLDGALRMFKSPWTVAILVDYFGGICFGVLYLYHLDGPSKVVAILLVVFGNPVLMWYMAYLLIISGSFTKAYLPLTDQQYVGSRNPRKSQLITVLFAGLLVFFVGVWMWATYAQSLADGMRDITRERFSTLTFADNFMGIAFAISYVIVREGSLSCTVVLWIVAFLVLGSTATCVYVILIALEAFRREVPFEKVLLSKANDEATSYV